MTRDELIEIFKGKDAEADAETVLSYLEKQTAKQRPWDNNWYNNIEVIKKSS